MIALRSVASSRSSFDRSRLVRLGLPLRLGGEFTAVAIINYYHGNRRLLKCHTLSSRAERLPRRSFSEGGRDLTFEAHVTRSTLRDQSPCVRSFTSFRMTARE